MQNIQFSDEELVAYLDGEDDFAPIDAIAMALKTDVALAKRLERLRIDTHAIGESFDAIIDLSKAAPEFPKSQKTVRPYRQVAVGAVLALLIGFLGGYLATDKSQPGWKDYAAAYHALYTNSTLNHVKVSTSFQQTELNRVAMAIGKDIELSSLTRVPEIEYKRAQVLGYKGKALIQLAFLTSLGEPLALCVIRSSEADTIDIEVYELEGMSTASWVKDGYEYVLIGGRNRTLISRLATAFFHG